MKWYDAAEDAKRRIAAAVADFVALNAERERLLQVASRDLASIDRIDAAINNAVKGRNEPFVEGCSYRPYDGTPYGQWRVTRDAPDADTWSVWDMRRGVPLRPVGLLVVKGLTSAQAGVAVAEWYAAHRVLRAGHAVYRALSTAAAIVREEWQL